jgi:hypothetical protein
VCVFELRRNILYLIALKHLGSNLVAIDVKKTLITNDTKLDMLTSVNERINCDGIHSSRVSY